MSSPLLYVESPSTSRPKAKRRRATRSVTGCLTCRFRKVKCVAQPSASTCDNCRRLRLTCNSSFGSNFKTWAPGRTSSPRLVRASPGSTPSGIGSSPSGRPNDEAPRSRSPSHSDDFSDESSLTSPGLSGPTLSHEAPAWASYGGEYGAQAGGCGETLADYSEAGAMRPQEGLDVPVTPEHSVLGGLTGFDAHGGQRVEGAGIPLSPLLPLGTFSFEDNQTMAETGIAQTDTMALSSQLLENLMWGISPQMPLVYGNSHGDMPLLDGAEAWVPDLLTLKTSTWNPYKYMVDSTVGQPDSPLRHGILSWACSYLSFRNHGPSGSDWVYNAAASQAVHSILNDLSTSLETITCSSTKRDAETAEKLYQLLSTTFFLCNRDLMQSDYKTFHERLDTLKRFFEKNWRKVQNSLTALDGRLLLWLAYMDLRASLFRGRAALPCNGGSSSRTPNADKDGPGASDLETRNTRNKDLLGVLVDLEALPKLRDHPAGQSYLSECFGDGYPRKEVEEDLIQEPCHRKCDDILAVFSSLNVFEQWDDDYRERVREDPVYAELRDAKIQALRANIARIEAECAVLFDHPSYNNNNNNNNNQVINRTTFHALTVTSLRLSATILLNRITGPDVRTDPQSQAAARELVLIARRLRKAKCLERPRWQAWPLPLFVAGIEVDDEIYREWLLGYLSELGRWDGSMARVRGLLERVIRKQEEAGRRVAVRDELREFDVGIII